MIEMRLWEVGFKEELHHSSYAYKFYVVASDAEEAERKGREYIVGEIDSWFYSEEHEEGTDGYKKERAEALTVLANYKLVKLLDIGKTLV